MYVYKHGNLTLILKLAPKSIVVGGDGGTIKGAITAICMARRVFIEIWAKKNTDQ